MPVFQKKPGGSWVCKFYFTDPGGSRRQKKKEGFRTKHEAQEFERTFLARSAGGCGMRFCDLAELYLEDCRVRLRPTTVETKQRIIRDKLVPFFGARTLSEITPGDIRRWQNALLADPRAFSPTYLKAIHNQASALFNYAVNYFQLAANPCRLAGPMGKTRAGEMRIWTPGEFARFLAAVEGKERSALMFPLLYWTGMRAGELLALEAADFDLGAGTVSITKSCTRLHGEDLLLPPKTPKSRRVIWLPDFLCARLAPWLEAHPQGRIFPVTKHYLYHEMERGCRESGVEKIRIHDLRHSHASFLIEEGFSPLLIAQRLGHESVQTTLEIYAHLYPNKHAQVARRIEEYVAAHGEK